MLNLSAFGFWENFENLNKVQFSHNVVWLIKHFSGAELGGYRSSI